MTDNPTRAVDRSALVEKLIVDLTAEATRRWGEGHAADLAAAIASTAETLALIGAVSLAHDDAEPDAGFER